MPSRKLFRFLENLPPASFSGIVLSQDSHFFSSVRNHVTNKDTTNVCHRLCRRLVPTPSLSQKLCAIRLETLGEGFSETLHLREHLILVWHRMAPPEVLRLRDESPSPLLPAFFLSQDRHLFSLLFRTSRHFKAYHSRRPNSSLPLEYRARDPVIILRPMIAVSDLGKSFGPQTLFEGVSIQFNPGNRYGLVGANGSCKPTFLP